MKPKVVIRSSKRFLIVAALLVLAAGSSAAVVPARAQVDSKIVYVAICVDSEYLGGSGQWMGSADPHPTLYVSEYSRTVPMTVAAVFSSDFRNSNRDSFGNVFKLSWFAEMDYLISQSNFVWADGSPAGVSGYTATRDLLVNNWGTEIQIYGDSVEYHHHFIIYDGTWKRYDSGPDAGYPGYHMYALDHMIIDRNFYPSTFRSGWWIMPPALSSWLEQWMPFDYTPTSGIWYPIHPSGMDRWQTKCPYAPDVPKAVNSAFAYASEHGSAVFSICTHDTENMRSQVGWLQWCLNAADADEATYPNVSFKYVSAREAMQRALGFTDFTPPTFTVTSSDNTYTIVSSEPLWKNHPYIALKYINGTYGHMSATLAGTNTWTVTPPTSVSVIGVAGSDLYGNPGTATFTQDQYALTVDTVGSGSVTKSPDQATYASGTVVTLTAVPSAGWSFSAWSGDVSGSVNPTTITMNGNKAVTATFTQLQYTLTVSVSPAGGGSVSRNITGPYHYGDVVQLTASPATGWSFSSWSGALTGSVNPADLTITGNMAVTATFTQNMYTLTVTTSGSGSVVLNNTGPYRYGDTVQLTANPTAGWSFDHWSGDLAGSVNPTTILMDGNKAVAATFVQVQYTLTVTIVGSGSVSRNNTGPYHYGDVVQLRATPSAGWSFTCWSGDLTDSQNPTTIVIDGHKSVTATFTQNEYTLTIANVGSGLVTKTPDQATYHYGDLVQLTAVPALGWSFAGWSGDLSGLTNPETISMTGNKVVTATFTQNQYTLTVNIEGSGSVEKVPDRATYDYATLVTLTAVANAGWSFSSWSGDLSGSNNPATITMDGDKSVTATFTQDLYTLTVLTVGSGSVVKNPDQVTYVYGDTVILTANPALGWSFSIWGGDLGGNTNPATIVMDGNKIVTATFTENQYTLTINTVGSGSVSKIPDQATYVYGTSVELTATSNTGWSFSQWTGDLTGSVNPVTIMINGNIVITATFTEDQYTLSITISGDGTVTKSPDLPTHSYGSVVTLTATPNNGWSFGGWSGDLIGSENPTTITMTSDKSVTVLFTQNQYTLTVSTVGSGFVTKVPEQATYTYGTSVELTAVPATGWSFQSWSGDLIGSTNPTTLVINGDKAVTVTFSQDQYTLTVSTSGSGSVSKVPNQATYIWGTSVTLTATADVGWSFASWSGDVAGTANPITINMTGNKAVAATFTQDTYTLSVSTVGSGSVNRNNSGPYHYGDVVELTAVPAMGWSFDHWSGDLTGCASPATITMDGSKSVTVTFVQNQYILSVTVVGSGTVAKDPDQLTYTYGTIVSLTAGPSVGWSFSGWSGGFVGNPTLVTITGDLTVAATFTQIEYSLTVNISPVDGGSVSKNPDSPHYHYNDVVQLTATPALGYSFAGWSDGLTGNPTLVTITGNTVVTATFTQLQYVLTINVVGSGSVTQSPDPPYTYGTEVTLTAVPATGWSFSGWSGDLPGSENPTTMVMDGNKAVTATFTQDQYTLSVTVEGSGSVSKNPDQATYTYGAEVQLTATSEVGWYFSGWNGDCSGSTNPATIIMNGNKAVTATFTQIEYSLTVYASPNEGGFVTKSPDYPHYHYNDIVQLTAAASAGWSFTVWSTGFSGNPTSVTITSDTVVTAYFTQNEYTLDVSIVGSGSVSKDPDQATYHLNDLVELAATPNAGWSFGGWSGDLTGSTSPASITINGNMAVTATFTQNTYSITASVIGVGGIIDPSGVVLVVAGGNQSFAITPDPCYVIADVVVDGVSQGAVSEYTFNSVAMDHSIVASFRLGAYIITASVDGVGGTIDPSGAVSVNGGETITFTITPESGYHILNVMVDGTYMGPQNSFTFYEVDRDHTITAIFAKNEYALTIIIVGAGSVRTNPNKISYSYGDIVELTAIPNNKNFQFAYWSGDLTGNTNPATIIIDGDKTVTATFTKKPKLPASSQIAISRSSVLPQEYSLTVSTVGSGSVVKVPDQASYNLGDVITLTATPTASWSFSAWSRDISSSLNPVSVSINGTTCVRPLSLRTRMP